jgi:hypothetical protein
MMPLGLDLMRTGRMKITREKIRGRDEIKKIFKALEA